MALRDILYLRRSDRIAIIFLLALILIISAAVFLAGRYDNSYIAERDSLYNDTTGYVSRRGYTTSYGGAYNRDSSRYYYATEQRPAELFTFDPNTADSTDLLRLGLAPWQVRSLYRYRAKGGIFRQPADFARLYGLTQGQYKRLEPYIRISPDFMPAADMFPRETTYNTRRDSLSYPIKILPGTTIGINTADTNSLKTVPGIGSAFAQAIVNYRERLGGYYAVEQLYDINNFPEVSIDYLRVDSCTLRKINVNRLKLSELKRHPYMGFHRAKAITDYRRLNGDIHDINELSTHRDFSPEAIQRLVPYIEY